MVTQTKGYQAADGSIHLTFNRAVASELLEFCEKELKLDIDASDAFKIVSNKTRIIEILGQKEST